jgi:hypothetical protein
MHALLVASRRARQGAGDLVLMGGGGAMIAQAAAQRSIKRNTSMQQNAILLKCVWQDWLSPPAVQKLRQAPKGTLAWGSDIVFNQQ